MGLSSMRAKVPSMKITVLTCCFALLLDGPFLKADTVLRPNDRVAICGDIYTACLGYSIYLEDYLLMCQPAPDLNVASFGWGAGDPAGFLAQMNTTLLPYKPTVVLLDFNGGDPNTRGGAETALVEALKKAGVRTIVIGSPECLDASLAQADAHNAGLKALADIDRDVAAKAGVLYADVFGDTLAAMKKLKAQNGDSFLFDTNVPWTPTTSQTITIAYAFLKALGCDGNIGTLTVDFTAGKAEGTPGQKIISFQDGKLTVESTRYPFCLGAIPESATPFDPLIGFIPFNEDLNRYTLIIKNLPTTQTKLYWSDEQRDFSSADLARGVNLPAVMGDRPFGGRAQFLNGPVLDQRQLEGTLGAALLQGKPDPQADAKKDAAFQIARSKIIPFQHTFQIVPLAPVEKPPPPGPIPVTIDTDMASDVDDAGAVALLNNFMDQGEANLIACATNAGNGNSGAVVQAINTWYGHPSIPIGSYHGEAGPATKMTSVLLPAPPEGYHGEGRKDGSLYTIAVHQRFCPNFPTGDKLPAGVDVYRKALAAAADGTVVMVSVGIMENFQDLIQSQPDSVSDLNGVDLVRKKVRELVIMANPMAQDIYFLSKWPTKILWTTDVGTLIGTGQSLIPTPENNPVRFAYEHYGTPAQNALKGGRGSWDLTASWLAIRGPGDLFDVLPGAPPFITGAGRTQPDQGTVTIKMPYGNVSKIIDAELGRPPKP
jgi:hypothetical protein